MFIVVLLAGLVMLWLFSLTRQINVNDKQLMRLRCDAVYALRELQQSLS